MGSLVTFLECVSCARRFDVPGERILTCPSCGPDRGTLDYHYDLETLSETFVRPTDAGEGIATWLPLLPIADPGLLPPLPIGPTPLICADRLASHLGLKAIWLKLDTYLPSASLKDRASAVALAHAREIKALVIAAASTGNAASSLATLAAASGQRAVLLVPEYAPPPKLAQIVLHGGILIPIRAGYDQVFDLSIKASEQFGWYVRSTAVNPILSEGKKSAALEAACQLEWRLRGPWFVGVGDGCIYGSFYKGLAEAGALGWIDELPPLMGVQAEGAAPLAHAWQFDESVVEPVAQVETYADSIAVGHPRDWVKALRAARESNGGIVAVPDDLIRDAVRVLARFAGVMAEPAGAASLAGVLAMISGGSLGAEDEAVVFITGHGLKDQRALLETVSFPAPADPDPAAIMARVYDVMGKKNTP